MMRWVLAVSLVWLITPSDLWALTLQQQAIARQDAAPLASGDSRILLDATLTSSAAATGAGFTLSGTGHVFDSNGFNGKGTGCLSIGNWVSQAAMQVKGTIYIQFERAALTFDESNNGGTFLDTVGTDNGAARYLFKGFNDGGTSQRSILHDGTSINGPQFVYRLNGVNQFPAFQYFNSHVSIYQDATYATVIMTWNGATYYVWLDDHLIHTGLTAALPAADDFDNIIIGAVSSSCTTPIGNFYIKRVQLSTAFMPPIHNQVRVGLYGDSFVRGMGGQVATPASDTVALIDGVQTSVKLTTRVTAYNSILGQTPWGLELQALSQRLLGFTFPMYTAAKGGAGWEINPMAVAYRDALNAFRPELIIALASVNDIQPSTPVTAIVANTKTQMDYLIDNNPDLRQIFFVVGQSGHRDPFHVSDATWFPEYQRVSSLLVAGLANYRGKVRVLGVYSAWGGDSYPLTQTIGSAPTNATGDAGNNLHPSPTGSTVMTSILWPYVRDFLNARPARP